MTFGLLASLAILGLSAIDPVGLAAMPILLAQKNPLTRSYAFLGGSFASLMIMGLVFAEGAGKAVLNFENAHTWVVPSVEVAAGVILLAIGATLVWQIKTGRDTVKGPNKLANARFSTIQLFIFGAELVAIQSLVDVVFVVAMIKVGQLHMATGNVVLAVAAYAIPALIFQLAIVTAYQATPNRRRVKLLLRVQKIIEHKVNQSIAYISFIIGVSLATNGILTFMGLPHA